ncbi:MAG: 16S rRNA (cytidine(1402)-2'-O)-methyltransferase [Candidatus Marinimicrobia bacterium]|nr:16S rRNA (cytidine(1402)-2'-O)-methyltransferase [Candidatus Neomarinimicrobiota bacterium]
MKRGKLYIVATPIGNLKDITFRAVEVLKKVDLVATEDTRKSEILFREYNIDTKKISYYEQNEEKRSSELIDRIQTGEDVALISDAGTPTVSDPGYRLMQKATENEIEIVPIPGASSVLTALVASGFPTDKFTFEGFLPKKKGRKTAFEELKDNPRTIIIFESKYRIIRTLEDVIKYLGDRRVVVGREMTKMHEEYLRGFASQIKEHFENVKPRGEFVIVIEGNWRKMKTREMVDNE